VEVEDATAARHHGGGTLRAFIRTVDLHKSYSRGAVSIPVLRGVTLGVERGQFVSVVGRSGSGKSTLLNLLGGLDTATSGTIVVGGHELTEMSRQGLAVHRRSTVGMIFQSFNLIPSRTALENITLALVFGGCPRGERRARAADLLTSVGLSHRMDHRPGELSGGEAQRVAIARALANDPAVLLADEPTGNLDSATAEEILTLLAALNGERGLTVVMVSHDETAVGRISDRMFRLLDGRVVDEINPERPH
jgi:putative ABC transport system ATP-binding protein